MQQDTDICAAKACEKAAKEERLPGMGLLGEKYREDCPFAWQEF
jgi:hypothetical protein